MAELLNQQRIDQIADAIAQTCAGVNSFVDDYDTAKTAAATANDMAYGKRESIMVAIAELSLAGLWTKVEIKLACKNAALKHNNTENKNAFAAFVGECKNAAAPLARAHVPALLAARNAAWDTEAEQLKLDPSAPAPLKKAFKRKYHALIRAMAATDDGVLLDTPDKLVAYAQQHDPDHDADKVRKRLDKIQQDLADFAVDFPVEIFGYVITRLDGVTKEDLTTARKEKIFNDTHIQGVEDKPVAPKPVPTPKPVPKYQDDIVVKPDLGKLVGAFNGGVSNVVVLPTIDEMDPDYLTGNNLPEMSSMVGA